MPDLALLEGAGLILAGMVVGRCWPGRRRGHRRRKAPDPVCGCSHHYSFHDPKTGECHGTKRGAVTGRSAYGYPDDWEQVPCGCRRYTGAEPLPEFFAPEIT